MEENCMITAKLRNVCSIFFVSLTAIVYPSLAFAAQDDMNHFLYMWAPLILMAIFLMFRMRSGTYGNYMKRQNEHMDKVEKLLERIASSVEKDRKQ
jgi:p-aminobenzoyl-glutamate transporter AbgT